MRIRAITKPPSGSNFIPHNQYTGHGIRMAPPKEVRHVHWRVLESILQAKRVDNKKRVMVIETHHDHSIGCVEVTLVGPYGLPVVLPG
jgi:hypothetical protein